MGDIPDEIESLLSTQKLPTVRQDCSYSVSKKSWIPEKLLHTLTTIERNNLQQVRFIVQESPSGIAKCRLCGVKIEKKVFRLGYPISDARGDYGILSGWAHIDCCNQLVKSVGSGLFSIEEIETLSDSAKRYHDIITDYEHQLKLKNYSQTVKDTSSVLSPDECIKAHQTSTPIIKTELKHLPSDNNPSIDLFGFKTDSPTANKLDSNLSDSSSTLINNSVPSCSSILTPKDIGYDKFDDSVSNEESSFIYTDIHVKDAIEELNQILERVYCVISPIFYCWNILDSATKKLLGLFVLNIGLKNIVPEQTNELLTNVVKRQLTKRQTPPPDLIIPLLPFQEEGLAWMCLQEESSIKGGILADEMGMGKTVQTIALLLEQKRRCQSHHSKLSDNLSTATSSPALPQQLEDKPLKSTDILKDTLQPEENGATLIIAPLAAVLQWKQEIERFTRPGSLRVLLYHGTCREALLRELHLYDVIITTYSTVEFDYRRVLNVYKVMCKFCGRMFLPDKLQFHLRYFCGTEAMRTARQAKTQKKQKAAAAKAMKTLNIKSDDDSDPEHFVPTITNVYKSILKEANRDHEVTHSNKVPWLKRRLDKTTELMSNETESLSDNDHTASKKRQRHETSELIKSNLKVRRASGTLENTHQINDVNKLNHNNIITTNTDHSDLLEINNELLNHLIEMGYKELDASHALQVTQNHIEQAVQYLIDKSTDQSHSDTDKDIDTSSRTQKSLHFRQQLRLSKTDIKKLKVAELQLMLRTIGASSFGTKVELTNRLTVLLYPEEWEKQTAADDNAILHHQGLFNELTTHDLNQSTHNTTIISPKKERRLTRQAFKKKSSTVSTPRDTTRVTQHPVKKKSNTTTIPNVSYPVTRQSTRLQPIHVTPVLKKKQQPSQTMSHKKKPQNKQRQERIELSDSSYTLSTDESDYSGTTSDWSDLTTTHVVVSSDDDLLSEDTHHNSSSASLLKKKKTLGKTIHTSQKHTLQHTNDDVERIMMIESEDTFDVSLSPLHMILWDRIILDEAHRIKGRTTSTAKAIYALKSRNYRWCLTGTPLQNRIGELYSLVRFIKMDPFAYYYCQKKDCQCRSLHYQFLNNKFCIQCQHPRTTHYSYFNRKIVTPIKNYGYSNEGRQGLKILKEQILDIVLLRRTKLERAEDVQLPPLNVLIRRDQLIPEERDFYESLYKQTQIQFNTYVNQGTILHNYAHIFDLLSRLRQAVDHPYLIVYGNLNSVITQDIPSVTNIATIPAPNRANCEVCWLCQDDIDNQHELIVSNCSHTFHKLCIQEYIASAPEQLNDKHHPLGCPRCYSLLTVDLSQLHATHQIDTESQLTSTTDPDDTYLLDDMTSHPTILGTTDTLDDSIVSSMPKKKSGILSRIKVSEFKSSTKIEALLQELTTIYDQDKEAKSIVFSQYTSMLDLIEWRLKKGGIHCAKLVGSLTLTARSNILYAFNTSPQLKVILISLKAGGEGLNLQVANNIFLMDPWWNPATEMQAIQRAHRIGQTKPVRAVRFICENTIEEKMLQLQEKKQLVFDGTVGASDAAMAKLTADDLRFLFQN